MIQFTRHYIFYEPLIQTKKMNIVLQGSPNQAKWVTFSPWFQWNRPIKSGRLQKIDPNFKFQNFLSPLPQCPHTFHKTNVLHNDLKKDAINEFGIKYCTSNPVWVILIVSVFRKSVAYICAKLICLWSFFRWSKKSFSCIYRSLLFSEHFTRWMRFAVDKSP
jgi:hypothetical protein